MTTRTPAEVFPPGEHLKEELEARGWSQSDLAAILGRPLPTVNRILVGKHGITPEMARALGAALGTGPELWMNLEASYQLWRARAEDTDAVAARAKLFDKAPIREVIRRGWIEGSNNIAVLEKRVLDFLEIKSLDEEPRFEYAARKSAPYESATPAQTAWVARARQLARAVHAAPWKPQNLDAALGRLRLLLHTPEEIRHVPRVLSDAGIRFVVVEHLAGSKIDGACFWLDGAPVVAVSLRYGRIDSFWFTLLHELEHVRQGNKSLDIDLDEAEKDADTPTAERAANQFAAAYLIPPTKLQSFIARHQPLFSAKHIEAFAKTIEVHPGIVVGQLQKRDAVSWANFRRMLVSIREWLVPVALTDGWGAVAPSGL